MNKIVKWVLVILLLGIIGFGIYSSGIISTITAPGQTYNANGVTFQYPESWKIAQSVADGSIAAVVNPNDSNISVVIQQVPSEYGSDIQTVCSNNNKNLALYGNYINIQEVKTTINNNSAILHRYIINEADGSQKEHLAAWMKMSDDKIYVILLSTPVASYEKQKSNFDLIAGTFSLKKSNDINSQNILESIQNRLNDGVNKFFGK